MANPNSPAGLPPKVIEAMRRGDPMAAIKAMREAHPKMGLADIRKFIEAAQKLAPQMPKPPVVKGQPAAPRPSHAHGPRPHTPRHEPAPTIHNIHARLSPGEVPRGGESSGPIVLLVIVVMAVLLLARFG